MTDGSSPTLRRRELGSRLRRLRTESGRSLEEVAEALLCSLSKVSRMETGQRVATPRDIRDLCQLYELTDAGTRDELMELSREARQHSWWRQYSDLGQVTTLIDYQDGASSIIEYDTCLVPGLLQTPDYARATIRGMLPRISEEVLEERTEARMRRQSLLEQHDPPTLWVLLDESALLRHVGDEAILAGQLAKLLDKAQLPHVTVQVIPLDVGAHPGFNSAFSFVEFRDSTQTPVVYTEGLAGELYLEGRAEIGRYREAVDHLRALALGPASSRNLIADRARRLEP
ncbi:helix-turn-helix domain-containing protein [Actinomadura rupiterrae]|uniref:helix-turn-helix domain-containing protein n=1 Tax=Actinomadura rupiterrae TaxID=559627 RepID=UPI0020A612AA|nr:helix-turn-helix transcriptional regulator [Actinomadura rupiterrae]MCP2337452.1 transcriptional regulator with XRE-family HTH domain [Actinomadura rupiterrae]